MAKPKGGSLKEKARRRAEERKRKEKGGRWLDLGDEEVEFFTMEKGQNFFDVVPYIVTRKDLEHAAAGELYYVRSVWIHYGIGDEDRSYVCAKKTYGHDQLKKCAICDYRAKLMNQADADEERIKDLRPREREIYNVIDLTKGEGEVQLMTLSSHNFGKQLEEEILEGNEDWGGFAELAGGYSLRVRMSEEVLGKTKFLRASRIDFEERDQDYDESMTDYTWDLDNIIVVLPYDDLKKIVYETEDVDSDRPSSSARRSPKRVPKKPAASRDKASEKEDKGKTTAKKPAAKKPASKRQPAKKPPAKKAPAKRTPPAKKEFDVETATYDELVAKVLSDELNIDVPDQWPEDDLRQAVREELETAGDGADAGAGEDDAPAAVEGECPYGHQFGVDTNKFDDCDDCDEWEACQTALENS